MHLALLLINGDLDIFHHIAQGVELILSLVHPRIKSGDPIIETIIHCCHGSFQLLITPLGGIDLVD